MAEVNPAAPTDPVVEPAPALTPGQKLAAAAPQPEPVAASKPAETTISPRAAKLAEFGFENVTNDDEAFDRLLSYTQNLKNEFGSQLQTALAELKQSQPTTTPQPQEAQTGKWTWTPPAVNSGMTGEELEKAKVARQAFFDSFAQRFVSDPAATLDPLLEDKFNAYFEQKFGQITAQQQVQSFQQQMFGDNPWLFEKDPLSGSPNLKALSAEGKLIDQYMREAQDRGADYEFAWDYALTKHRASKAELSNRQTAQAQTAEQLNAQHKANLLNRANGNSTRAGSMPQPAAPTQTQNTHLSFGERLRQNAERNGVPLNPVA